jgi:hypothetical protein
LCNPFKGLRFFAAAIAYEKTKMSLEEDFDPLHACQAGIP